MKTLKKPRGTIECPQAPAGWRWHTSRHCVGAERARVAASARNGLASRAHRARYQAGSAESGLVPGTSPLQPIIGVSQRDPERRSNSLGHCTVAVLPRIAALFPQIATDIRY